MHRERRRLFGSLRIRAEKTQTGAYLELKTIWKSRGDLSYSELEASSSFR
jgi:hypothetical protein